MKSTRKLALWALAFGVLSVLPLEAQPGGRGGGISPGQVFGLLAFDEKFNVTDQQLLALRGALRPLHGEQQQAHSKANVWMRVLAMLAIRWFLKHLRTESRYPRCQQLQRRQ